MADFYPKFEPEGAPPEDQGKGTEAEGETALLPKSLCAGKELKPGDTLTFKVVHMYDDEIEVSPVSSPSPETEDENETETEDETEDEGAPEGEMPPEEIMSADQEIDKMASMKSRKAM